MAEPAAICGDRTLLLNNHDNEIFFRCGEDKDIFIIKVKYVSTKLTFFYRSLNEQLHAIGVIRM